MFDAFELRVTYDKPERRIAISATIAQAVAKALENTKDLPKEVSAVTQRDIAGARFVSRGDAPKLVESYRLAA